MQSFIDQCLMALRVKWRVGTVGKVPAPRAEARQGRRSRVQNQAVGRERLYLLLMNFLPDPYEFSIVMVIWLRTMAARNVICPTSEIERTALEGREPDLCRKGLELENH